MQAGSIPSDQSGQGEILFLNATLERTRLEMRQLIARETQFLRRLNDLRSATVILPTEVLATVFEYACAGVNASPLILGGVCTRWRGIIWSTPRLWTSLSISLTLDHDECGLPTRRYEILSLYFENLKALSLSLHLHGFIFWPEEDEPLPHQPFASYREFFNFIFRVNLHKLRGFTFRDFEAEWWDIFCDSFQPGLAANLAFLDLGWFSGSRPINTNISFPTSPLTKVSLFEEISSRGRLQLLQLPWAQLTILELFLVPYDQCLKLLANMCPCLKEFRCIRPKSIPVPFSILDYPRTSLPNLETLEWHFRNNSWTQFLLTSMHFPSLRHLYCQSALKLVSDFLPFMNEFTQKSGNLTTFGSGAIPESYRELDFRSRSDEEDCPNDDQRLHRLFTLPKLRRLQELRLAIDPFCDFEYFFTKLNIENQADSGEQILPQLQVLEVHFVTNPSRELFFTPAVLSAFVEMLRSRRVDGRHEWTEYAQLKCARFVNLFSLGRGRSAENEPQMRVLERLMDEGLEVVLIP